MRRSCSVAKWMFVFGSTQLFIYSHQQFYRIRMTHGKSLRSGRMRDNSN